MKTRSITPLDIPEIFRWFESRKWPMPPIENVAPGDGFVCEEDDRMLACAWVYFTGRSIAILEWTATNPDLPDGLTQHALHKCVDSIKDYCQHVSPPIKALCLFTQNEKLADSFERMKFKKQGGYQRLLWTCR